MIFFLTLDVPCRIKLSGKSENWAKSHKNLSLYVLFNESNVMKVRLGRSEIYIPALSIFHNLMILSLFFKSPATRLYNVVYIPLCLSVPFLLFFYVFSLVCSLASLLLPKCFGDLKYGPCLPARAWGRRLSGLVFTCHMGYA